MHAACLIRILQGVIAMLTRDDRRQLWDQLHAGGAQDRLSPFLAAAWAQCASMGVKPDLDALPCLPPEQFEEAKWNAIRAYGYANRFLFKMLPLVSNPNMGFALFDPKGVLLKLYGAENIQSWCRAHGIARNTVWRMETIGANAVALGLQQYKTMSTVGEEHYCKPLLDVAVHFSPFVTDNEQRPGEYLCHGGMALLLPAEQSSPDYLLLAAAAAYDVSLHMYMGDNLHSMYLPDNRGMFSVNINVTNGKCHILYHNANIFDTFKIPYENLYYQKVEQLLDPLPSNQDFWSILKEGKTVFEKQLTLSVHGRESTYLVTTEPYHQSYLGFKGIRFFIAAPSQISSNVSRRIGNNAMKTFDDIVGDSPQIISALRLARGIARSDSNTLLLGESGVGKDIFAQAIHNASARRDKPFIVLNCAAFPRDLIASELFGYEQGAFTGAKRNGNIGKFELANTGTIFLDEIGEMPLDLQATLLRVIEQKAFMRLGGSTVIHVDVKIIAATNADLIHLVEQKKFRADLYYRLSTLRLNIPPLRDRGNDVILLARHFARVVCHRIQRSVPAELAPDAEQLLLQLPLKGNVRELQNLIEGVIQLNSDFYIEARHFQEYLGMSPAGEEDSVLPPPPDAPASTIGTAPPQQSLTREALEHALLINRFNRTDTARYLGVSRRTLYRWMERYHL